MPPTLLWRPVRGPSTEPTLVPLVATRWLLGTFNVRNWEWKFTIFWCLKNFGTHWCQKLQEQGYLCKSGHETSRSSDAMHTPDADQQVLSEMVNQNLKKVNFWCVDKGALPPMTPVNPYSWGNTWKNGPLFNCQPIYAHFAKYGPRGPLWAIYEPGGPGCRRHLLYRNG